MRSEPLPFLLGAVLTASLPAQDAADPDRAGALEARIAAFDAGFDDANRLSGVLLIARGDQVVLHRAYGLAHRELGVTNTVDTRFCIASIEKPLTAIVLAKLLGEGLLRADAPARSLVPELAPHDFTIEHLARHRAGLPHRVTTSVEEAMPWTAQQVAERAAAVPLLFAPGSESSYSSAGFTVLARCIERAADADYAELLRSRVFEPAGMQRSVEPQPGRGVEGAATSYVPGRGELWPAPPKDLAFLRGAGSTFSTAGDLLRLVQALRSGRLGVPFAQFARDGRLGWTGATNGWFAFVDVHPEHDLTCIWVGNTWGGCPGQLRAVLPRLCGGEDVVPAPRPALAATPPIAALRACAGEYRSRPGATTVAAERGGALWFADSMLLPIGDDRFWHQPWHCELAFARDENGAVVAVERRGDGEAARWPRVGQEGDGGAGVAAEAAVEPAAEPDVEAAAGGVGEPAAPPTAAPSPQLVAAIEAQCRAMEAQLVEDAAGVARFYADDALLIDPSGSTVRGRADLDAYWARFGGATAWRLETRSIEGRGRIAVQRGRSVLTLGAGRRRQQSVVEFQLVWRRDADGEWRVAVDAYW
ncbi:MAG: serine hydrolase [Planctomycetota bacterium]